MPATPEELFAHVADACGFPASPLTSRISGHDPVVDSGVPARPTR